MVGKEISQTGCQGLFYEGQYTFLRDSLIGECCNLVVCTGNSIWYSIIQHLKYGILILRINKYWITIQWTDYGVS